MTTKIFAAKTERARGPITGAEPESPGRRAGAGRSGADRTRQSQVEHLQPAAEALMLMVVKLLP